MDTAQDVPAAVHAVVRVLGCSGGIGGPHLRTTSLLLDNDVLIDAGTGVQDLSLDELACIDHVFVTHSHLDHICSIPFMADAVGGQRSRPLVIHALAETIAALKQHIFNWQVWPDFAELPSPDRPTIVYQPLSLGETVALIAGRTVTALPASHVVPAVGYCITSATGASVVFTGDTGPNPPLWREVNRIDDLRVLIVETAFCNRERALALVSRHLCPDTLAEELAQMQPQPEVYITHLKPGEAELAMDEVAVAAAAWAPRMLMRGQRFEF